MLPKSLVSVYQEYKKDTNSVASWLASTAKACGYPADLISNAHPPRKQPKASGRPKGKARTGGKKKGKAPAKHVPETAPTHVIAIKDFVPLAECIAASKDPVISIPEAFDKAITRVIAVRSSFSEKLSEHGVEPDARSDIRHSYFVGVLEKVRGLLNPLISTSASASPDPVETLNKFSGLKVYEPSEVFLNAPDIERPEKTGQENIIYEAEPPQSLADALVAFWMMLEDLRKIRDFIFNIWSDFIDEADNRFLDPAAVAIATNTGIDFARNLIDDMLPVFEDHGGAYAICQEYFTRVLLQRGYSTEDIEAWMHEDTKHDFYDLASVCYFNAGRLINTLARLPFQGYVPIYEDGAFGVYDPASDWEAKTGHEKFKEDEILITELFMEALTIVHHVPDYPIVDEFIRGVKEFHETQKVPFFLIFAAQITLDIHHVLRGYAETAVTILFERLSTMNALLQSHIAYHENLKSPHWSSSNEEVLKDSQKVLGWFMEDPLQKAKALIAGRGRHTMVESIKKHRLLRRSPIVTGLALYHFRADMYETGIAVTNAWGSIILPAHLYNAVSEEGLTACLWYDMELLFKKLGEEQFFVGGRSTNVADYLKRFLLQIGVSASVLTNRRRPSSRLTASINDFSRAGPRFIKHGATVSRSFLDRYWKNTGPINWTPESIKEILSYSQLQEQEVDGVTLVGRTDDSQQPGRRRGAPQARPKHNRTEFADSRRFSAAELLGSLVLAMHAEVMEFAFPYLLMHRLNWEMMKAVKNGCDTLLRERFGPAYIRYEWELPFMIGNILALADGVDGPEDSSALEVVGAVFDTMDATETVSAVTRVLVQTTGLRLEIPEYYDIEGDDGFDESNEEDD